MGRGCKPRPAYLQRLGRGCKPRPAYLQNFRNFQNFLIILWELIMTEDEFEKWWYGQPESKFELIDGKFTVGNSLIGSQLLFRMILEGWGAAPVVALVDRKLVWQALKVVYPEIPIDSDEPTIIQTWASRVNHQPADLSAGSKGEDGGKHFKTRYFLHRQLSKAINFGVDGNTIGPDFLMHLGNNGFTPDMLVYCGKPLNYPYNWYLQGPADLVIEVTLPTHAKQDREVKRHYYEAGGVPEYWIVDPQHQQIEFLRLKNGQYQLQYPDSEGDYCPHNIPNLVFWPEKLWHYCRIHDYDHFELAIFDVNPWPSKQIKKTLTIDQEGGFKPNSVPMNFRVALEPMPISFEEFVSWCPSNKVEYTNDKIHISKMREIMGMFLMTLGMVETVKLLSPQQWVTALIAAQANELTDAATKAEWWEVAKQAAIFLREKYGAKRLAVAEDLVAPHPLNYWSEIILVVYDLSREKRREALEEWYAKYKNPPIYFAEPEYVGDGITNAI